VTEICSILRDIEGGKLTAEVVAANLAQIVVSTNESLDDFIEMHQV